VVKTFTSENVANKRKDGERRSRAGVRIQRLENRLDQVTADAGEGEAS